MAALLATAASSSPSPSQQPTQHPPHLSLLNRSGGGLHTPKPHPLLQKSPPQRSQSRSNEPSYNVLPPVTNTAGKVPPLPHLSSLNCSGGGSHTPKVHPLLQKSPPQRSQSRSNAPSLNVLPSVANAAGEVPPPPHPSSLNRSGGGSHTPKPHPLL